MENLIELVAASFARHGIECSADDAQLGCPSSGRSTSDRFTAGPEPVLVGAFPEHNYRKIVQADPSP